MQKQAFVQASPVETDKLTRHAEPSGDQIPARSSHSRITRARLIISSLSSIPCDADITTLSSKRAKNQLRKDYALLVCFLCYLTQRFALYKRKLSGVTGQARLLGTRESRDSVGHRLYPTRLGHQILQPRAPAYELKVSTRSFKPSTNSPIPMLLSSPRCTPMVD